MTLLIMKVPLSAGVWTQNSLNHPRSRPVCPILSGTQQVLGLQVLRRAVKSSSHTILVWSLYASSELFPELLPRCWLCSYTQYSCVPHPWWQGRNKVYWLQHHLADEFLNTHHHCKNLNAALCTCAGWAWLYKWWEKTWEIVTQNIKAPNVLW